MTDTLPREALDNVQRLALKGFDTERCMHLILRVADAQRARAFLRAICDRGWVKDSASGPDSNHPLVGAGSVPTAMNIGFTLRGLDAIGLESRYLSAFKALAPAFEQGARARAAQLGDTGASAAEYWEDRFALDEAHVLISLHSDQQDLLYEAATRLHEVSGNALTGWEEPLHGKQLSSDPDGDGGKIRTAHFGFRDGIARPAIKVHGQSEAPNQEVHPAGELFLGYSNGEGYDRWTDALSSDVVGFFRDGSFAAFRKIAQDEETLDDFLRRAASKGGMTPDLLKAKLCGRWPNGAVLKPGVTTAPTQPPPADEANKFTFKDDKEGHGCPFGAHIRRNNPRADPVVHPRRRPLYRRGMPYGTKYTGPGDATPRGLLGLFFCASLEDQFEHVMSEWIDKVPIRPGDRGDAKDPLAGHHDDLHAEFRIPRAGQSDIAISGLTPFTTTRGGLYAFYPSLRALSVIAGTDKSSTTALPVIGSSPRAVAPASPVPPASAGLSARASGHGTEDTAPPDRYCDIVMEGGITSGLLYPAAVGELAKKFRLKCIGGTSIGAFAAAATAAAEFARRNGSLDGFSLLQNLPERLAHVKHGETHLFWMFRPEPDTRRLFRVFLATLNRSSWTGRVGAAIGAAFCQYRRAAGIGVAVVTLLFVACLAMVVLLAIAGASHGGWLIALGALAIVGCIAAYLGLAIVAASIGVVVAALSDVRNGLVPNGFGLCKGGPRIVRETGRPDPKLDPLPLTVTLHRLIQACAGRTQPDAAPLTFEDLWNAPGFPPAWLPASLPKGQRHRSIDLQVYTTNLTYGRPYRFPAVPGDDMGRLFFRAAELAPYFPQSVMNHLVGYAVPYAPKAWSDPPVENVESDILELPQAKLPIVVAARLSLSFPLLISAVPLWAIDFEPSKPDRKMQRCWFSDGGLCSNFPIHLFDAFVPKWPTFGISLQTRSKVRSNQRVWLPTWHRQGRGDLRSTRDPELGSPLAKLGNFLSCLWLATWRWNDMTQMRMPGVRDRVVRVFLEEREGGINLRISPQEILGLARKYGKPAAEAFLKKFVDGPGWDEHRWVRVNSLLVALRDRVHLLKYAIAQRHQATPLREQIRAAESRAPLTGPGEKVIEANQAFELQRLIAALEALEQAYVDAGDTEPYIPNPRPSLRMRYPV
jgi:deferrochelatase/peroxidase EfeB/predicted acylesterase/phospholipase RssA